MKQQDEEEINVDDEKQPLISPSNSKSEESKDKRQILARKFTILKTNFSKYHSTVSSCTEENASPIIMRHENSFSPLLSYHNRQTTSPSPDYDDEDSYIDIHLLKESMVSLMFSTCGLIGAGYMFDYIQHADVFLRVTELIILVPVLLNLKGNLELNLSVRLSTAANLGKLDDAHSQYNIIFGNLVIMQIQGTVVGLVSGLFALLMGHLFQEIPNTSFESVLTVSSAMWTACLASLVLGTFMSIMVLLSRHVFHVNPDNIMAPMASSLGDITALGVLFGVSYLLSLQDIAIISFTIFMLLLLLPFYVKFSLNNDNVKQLLMHGWTPLFLSMLISNCSGLALEKYIVQFPMMAFLSPVLTGIAGNLSAIYASRITTALVSGKSENHGRTKRTLFLINFITQILVIIAFSLLGQVHDGDDLILCISFYFSLVVISFVLLILILTLTRKLCDLLWRFKFDLHSYAMPLITSAADLTGTILLIALLTLMSPTIT